MFEVIHKNDNTNSSHETEEDAVKQVKGCYGPDIFIDDNDRPSGRLRVWTSLADASNDFGSPIAKIVLERDVDKEEVVAEPKHEKKSPPVQATEPEDVDQSHPIHHKKAKK